MNGPHTIRNFRVDEGARPRLLFVAVHDALMCRYFLGSFARIIAGSGPGRSTYLAVRICEATSLSCDRKI